MSDTEGDIDSELLALVADEGREKKRKRKGSSGKSGKRRKPEMGSDSEDQPESEEEETNLYPLEGKYIDESDRQKLLQMSEIEREEILSQRLEELQRAQDKKNLDAMLREQSGKSMDPDSVAKAAKRTHALKGATKEKTRKLDELKARRKAKDEKKTRTKTNSPKRDRSSSPTDMEISDEEEEEGQFSKNDEQEEKERRLLNKVNPDDEPITMADLEKCRLTRDAIAKFCLAPWFEDYIKGAWVRYLVGTDNDGGVYRICEITNLAAEIGRPYKVNDVVYNQGFDLKHGKSVRSFLMDKVSNVAFCQKEFDRLVKTYKADEVKLPSKRSLEKKSAQLIKLSNQPMTEADISSMLARKNALLNSTGSNGRHAMEKSRLTQARTLALRRQDWDEVKAIDAKLQAFASLTPASARSQTDSVSEKLAAVNERNRKANLEQVRKAELAEAERRRERKLAAAMASRSNTPQQGGKSQELKTLPKTIANMSVSSRTGSPLPGGFESSVVDSIEVDLGDF